MDTWRGKGYLCHSVHKHGDIGGGWTSDDNHTKKKYYTMVEAKKDFLRQVENKYIDKQPGVLLDYGQLRDLFLSIQKKYGIQHLADIPQAEWIRDANKRLGLGTQEINGVVFGKKSPSPVYVDRYGNKKR